jgi:SAM-dependent methyltransferase
MACGTGKHLELLRDRYRVEGVDLDPEMLDIARARLGPGIPLHVGDMVHFDLGKRFDVVTCLFSSVAYAVTPERLASAIGAMAHHVAPSGVLAVEPFFAPDEWEPGHLNAIFVDEPTLKVARLTLSGPPAGRVTLTFHYLVGTPDGIEQFTEDHEVGLFTREQYAEAFRASGITPQYDPEGLMGRGLYIGGVE